MASHTCYNCFREKPRSDGFCPYCGYGDSRDAGKYPLALKPGSILGGRYVVGRVLGQGGFGITYVARDEHTGEKVAIKEFFPETMASRTDGHSVAAFSGPLQENFDYGMQCFLAEAQTLAQFLGSENIVRVHSYFEENGTAYFVMDYVEGVSLQTYLKKRGGKVAWEEAKALLLPVMDALSTVHSKGIIHRDIAPDNIYITHDGKVKLLDFGAARYSLGDRSRSLDVVLKAGYAPVEQYTRRGRQGPFTDIYALAATWYFAITGRTPPESVERMEEDLLVLPSSQGISLPAEAEDALEKALSVRAVDRFPSVAAFRDALVQSTPVPVQDPPPVILYDPPPMKPPVKQPVKPPVVPEPAPVPEDLPIRAEKKPFPGKILAAAAAVLAAVVLLVLLFPKDAKKPSPAPEDPVRVSSKEDPAPAVSRDSKIGIITAGITMSQEEYFAAQDLQEQYGDKVITATFPDNYYTDTELTIATVTSMAADPDVKAILIPYALPGTAEAITRVRQTRDDILFIAGQCSDDPSAIADAADICLITDEANSAYAIIDQAVKQGARTFVHISFERHLSYATIATRRSLFKERCEQMGVEYVEATAPDPTGDAGVTGSQAWITENLRIYVEHYGKDTAFFCTNCSMQPPLIQQVAELGAIFPQQCCPSPFHGYPAAFDIDTEGRETDVPYILEQITAKVAEYGNSGRMSTWSVPAPMVLLQASYSYAQKWLQGQIQDRCDPSALLAEIQAVGGEGISLDTYQDSYAGALSNYFTYRGVFYDF